MSMYNETQKMEYIEFESKTSRTLTGYFKRISKMESEYGKDLVDMNLDELLNTFRSLNLVRAETRSHCISLMRGYYNWAKLNGKTENNSPILTLGAENIGQKSAIKSKLFGSPEQVQEVLDTALDFINYENRSTRDSLLVWLLYAGLTFNEIQILQKTDIKPATQDIITNEGKIYSIDSNIEKLWSEFSEMDSIERANSKRAGDFTSYKLYESEYLFRPIAGNKGDTNPLISKNTLNMILVRIFAEYSENNDYNLNVSPLNIKYSGIYYKLYQMELQGEEVSAKTIAKSFDVEYKDESELLSKTWKWRTDYEDWKHTFDYM